jgi:hypothetical protein
MPEQDTNICKGTEVDDLHRYLGYFTKKSLFESEDEFIEQFLNLEDEIVSYINQFNRLLEIKNNILKDIRELEAVIFPSNILEMQKLNYLRNRNSELKKEKEIIQTSAKINTKSNNEEMKDINKQINKLNNLVHDIPETSYNQNEYLTTMCKTEVKINSLFMSIESYKNIQNFEEIIKNIKTEI